METKTYFANSIQAAMEVARKELGPDAMLVKSEPAPEAARPFGPLEVTFAWEPGVTEKGTPDYLGPRPVESAFRQKAEGEISPARRGESGLEDIRLEISALRAAIGRQEAGSRAADSSGVVAISTDTNGGVIEKLCESGFEKDTARQLVSGAAAGTGRAGDGMLRELTARIPVAAFSPLKTDESRTLAFVGPAGRGKTTSLIKIAVRFGLAARIPVRIYLAGAHGIGVAEQMARYAAILGVPFQAVESFESLNLALQGERWKGLVLIDTPGIGAGDRQEMDAMAKFFARRAEIERHLVLRAEARSADMQYMLSRFSPIRPSRLLFTGLDEVNALGAAADTMIRSGIPATFLGTGSRIPDDLEEVDIAKMARSLWATKGLAARAA